MAIPRFHPLVLSWAVVILLTGTLWLLARSSPGVVSATAQRRRDL
jgi:hypothetical protein